MVPGHLHLRELAEQVKQGIAASGGVPVASETIAICDGLCQGHNGMRYPLASRDLIADSVEMVVEAHHFDAMALLAGCDKIIPGMWMAAARLDIPDGDRPWRADAARKRGRKSPVLFRYEGPKGGPGMREMLWRLI